MRFGEKGKLSTRYIGPFDILQRIGEVAYRLSLPPNLSHVHNLFHVSLLRKYMANPSHVLRVEPIQVHKDLSYDEQPMRILDYKEQIMRTKTIPLAKVLWRNYGVEEATWEFEQMMRQEYPHIFESVV
ncbi:Chromo domain-containing protein [Cephalotus follicularis]|uniref:Chromo domain-containing protein n=1 Tax=Cephalotus follicularis TaxID=3775 RepID=A0A1Q3DED8_CEPFO|nr:Chromo domain-containing protein [Cephalotus follicularis]